MERRLAQIRIGILLLLAGITAILCTASVTPFMVQSAKVPNTSASQGTLRRANEGNMSTSDIVTTTVTSTSAGNA